MIGKLKGTLDHVGAEHCIVDVNGVGYVAHCPSATLAALGGEGSPVTLFIETHVREDMIRLYGFSTMAEKDWFNLLLSNVQGVGAKIALSLLSTLGGEGIAAAVGAGDLASLCRAPGIGKKVAERIVAELKGKVPASAAPAMSRLEDDAVKTLTTLGYGRTEAVAAVSAAARERSYGPDDVDILLRTAMRLASRS